MNWAGNIFFINKNMKVESGVVDIIYIFFIFLSKFLYNKKLNLNTKKYNLIPIF